MTCGSAHLAALRLEWGTQNNSHLLHRTRPRESRRTVRSSASAGPRGSSRKGLHMDAKTPPAHGANTKSAQLTVGEKNYAFPIYEGTIGPDVIDISKLYGQAGIFTYDPGFTSTASCESKITYIDGDEGILLYRGYPIEQLAENGDFLETCYLLLYGELPTKAQKAGLRLSRHPPHDGARADEPLLPGLPPRRASDGGDVRRGRRAVGVLSRLHRHLRSDAAHDRLDAHDRQDADARRDGLQVFDRPAVHLSAERSRLTRPTSCACASRCRARSTSRTRCWRARWTASSSCTPTTSRTPRPRRCGSPARRAPTRSPASRPASPACGARRMAAPTRRRSRCSPRSARSTASPNTSSARRTRTTASA